MLSYLLQPWNERTRLSLSGFAEMRDLGVQAVRAERGVSMAHEVQVHHIMVDAVERGHAGVRGRVAGGDAA